MSFECNHYWKHQVTWFWALVRKKKQFIHDDVIKWKHFPRYWPFVWGINRFPANSPHKGQWRGAFVFSLMCVWINGWVNNREAGYLRRYRAHCDVTVMLKQKRIYCYRNYKPVTWNRRSDKQDGWCITHFKGQTADNRNIFVKIPRILVKYIYIQENYIGNIFRPFVSRVPL